MNPLADPETKTLRIVVTADLHLEITGKEPIRRMVAGIAHSAPDVVVIAGDIGNPAMLYEECLSEFLKLNCPVLTVVGNHDLWCDHLFTSMQLWEEELPRINKMLGMGWLDGEEPARFGPVGIAGSVGWYDYSAREPGLNQTDEDIIRVKPQLAGDAERMDWELTDPDFAAGCRARLKAQLDSLEADDDIRVILVVTHVPIYDNQIDRRPEDEHWSLGNPYFGHLTMGELVNQYAKVRWVISGHTHVEKRGVIDRPGMPPIATAVLGADYYKPRYFVLDTD